MHARIAILLASGAAFLAPAAHAAEGAGVRMLSCEPWVESIGGAVTYSAHMHSVEGSKRMALRIRLFEKVGDGRFERVSAKGLGIWRKSSPDAELFRYRQRVEGLHQGAIYRAVVRFRWRGSDGQVIRTERRRSPRCVQPGSPPNLRVAKIDVEPGEVEGTAVYKATVVNRGGGPARNAGVLLRVDGAVVDEKKIDLIPAGERRTVAFSGPVCHKRMRVIADPKDLIPESREQDNMLAVPCV